ncbi:unnamed protein product [Blepharisma stoltei]|uniref:MORN repeat protein n=1 Tax=Blepharisma stoltei TaxID=1481888 RepID=A0AAU9IIA8_9CILI|nr:unnamed protein product [Blepharisma stoltei]
MGTGCNSCLKDADFYEERYIIDKNTNKRLKKQDSSLILFSPHQTYTNYSSASVIFIQSLIRGYIERKSLSVKLKEPLHTRCESDTNSRSIMEIWGSFPDYSNAATIATAKAMGRFKYQKNIIDNVKVFKKGPVQIEGGAIYIGEWNEKWERHGRGIQTWKDGSKYEGHWKNDLAGGKGRLIHGDGDCYEGDWVDGKANGKGVYIHTDGTRYEGDWLNDKQHGQGIETWSNGSRYEGSYEYGKKQGKGKLLLSDGGSYEGDFYEGKIHGYGIYKWSDLRKYSGEWKNNKMDGQGTFLWSDGRCYKGEYHNDHKHGFGVFTWPNGKSYEGFWEDGKQNGIGKAIYSDGRVEEGEWKDGKLVAK